MQFVRKRILKQFVSIEKAAYKEVNFKSKLIEWAQKNRTEIEFKLIEETRDMSQNSPVFKTRSMASEHLQRVPAQAIQA